MKRLMHSLPHVGLSTVQLSTSIKSLVFQGLYPQAVRVSVETHDVRLIEQIYSLFVKSGSFLDIFLGSSIIDCFSKLGHPHYAHRFLHDMPETDTVVWNTLITGYSRNHQTDDAFALFNSLRCIGLKPDMFTLSSLIKACDNAYYNESAHGVTLKMGWSSGAFICSGLINNYSKLGDIESAEKCFEECMVVDTVVWTTMISGYVLNRESEMAQKLFMEMRELEIILNHFSLTSVLGSLSNIKEGQQIHGLSMKLGFHACSTPLSNAIMTMYCHFGNKRDRVNFFDEIPHPDVISWAARIGASYDGEEALEIFKNLCSRNELINEYTFINVLSAVWEPKFLKPGKQLQACCFKTGYFSFTAIGNALISMYGRCLCIEEARKVFDEIVHRDCVTWNALLAVYGENGCINLSLEMFSRMRRSLFKENKFTLASILEVLSKSKAPQRTKEIHAHIIKSGVISDDSMVTCLLRAYGQGDEIENMMLLFSNIYTPDVVHLNAILSSLVHTGYYEHAMKFFQGTWDRSLGVDGITLSVLLKACGALTALEQGKSVHSLSLKCGISQDSFVGSALVDVYCKCGSIEDGRLVFKELSADNIAAWNAMIMGYAKHGYIEQVFELFSEMIISGIGVDDVTCLGYLTSCCHSGFVKEACSFLDSMVECHGVVPQLEHYACLVDLLGRVGELEEAKKNIERMPFPPDAQMWQILLSACTLHGNLELGKVVYLKLLELQPENDSAHVVLLNLHASVGVWNEVGRFRMMMRENTIFKEPGASWIQIKGILYSFFANDTSHSEAAEIRLKLQDLSNQIKTEPQIDECFAPQFVADDG